MQDKELPEKLAGLQGQTAEGAVDDGGSAQRMQMARMKRAVQRKAAAGDAEKTIQRKLNEEPGGEDAIRTAEEGVAGEGAPLPHLDAIQKSFGPHDVSGIRAFSGGKAEAANAKMGAQAYTVGNRVALGAGSDLRTVAHEAAHAVQQQRGIAPESGQGKEGDHHERHADEVADRVVAGKSAAPLLGAPMRAEWKGGSARAAVQHKKLTPATAQAEIQKKPKDKLQAFCTECLKEAKSRAEAEQILNWFWNYSSHIDVDAKVFYRSAWEQAGKWGAYPADREDKAGQAPLVQQQVDKAQMALADKSLGQSIGAGAKALGGGVGKVLSIPDKLTGKVKGAAGNAVSAIGDKVSEHKAKAYSQLGDEDAPEPASEATPDAAAEGGEAQSEEAFAGGDESKSDDGEALLEGGGDVGKLAKQSAKSAGKSAVDALASVPGRLLKGLGGPILSIISQVSSAIEGLGSAGEAMAIQAKIVQCYKDLEAVQAMNAGAQVFDPAVRDALIQAAGALPKNRLGGKARSAAMTAGGYGEKYGHVDEHGGAFSHSTHVDPHEAGTGLKDEGGKRTVVDDPTKETKKSGSESKDEDDDFDPRGLNKQSPAAAADVDAEEEDDFNPRATGFVAKPGAEAKERAKEASQRSDTYGQTKEATAYREARKFGAGAALHKGVQAVKGVINKDSDSKEMIANALVQGLASPHETDQMIAKMILTSVLGLPEKADADTIRRAL